MLGYSAAPQGREQDSRLKEQMDEIKGTLHQKCGDFASWRNWKQHVYSFTSSVCRQTLKISVIWMESGFKTNTNRAGTLSLRVLRWFPSHPLRVRRIIKTSQSADDVQDASSWRCGKPGHAAERRRIWFIKTEIIWELNVSAQTQINALFVVDVSSYSGLFCCSSNIQNNKWRHECSFVSAATEAEDSPEHC